MCWLALVLVLVLALAFANPAKDPSATFGKSATHDQVNEHVIVVLVVVVLHLPLPHHQSLSKL